jgi:hypothetical protein
VGDDESAMRGEERVMRKCSHIASRFTFVDGVPMLLQCTGCHALLSMGPSNDKPAAVRVEMRAAGLIQHRVMRTKRKFMTRLEYLGMINVQHNEMESLQWRAGETLMEWLACDDPSLKTFDAWPWDITRPIAEQGPNVPASDDIQPGFLRGGKLLDAALDVTAANDVGAAAELHASSQEATALVGLVDGAADRIGWGGLPIDHPSSIAAVRDPNEPALDCQEFVPAAIEADKPVLKPIDWPGYVGVEKPTGDPLDADVRIAWNADLDAVESAS